MSLSSNRYQTTLALIAEGHGISLVPRTAVDGAPQAVAVRPLAPGAPPRRIWTVTEPEPPTISTAFHKAARAAVEAQLEPTTVGEP